MSAHEQCICEELSPAYGRIHCPVHGLFAGLTRDQLRERAEAAESLLAQLQAENERLRSVIDLCQDELGEDSREIERLTEGLRRIADTLDQAPWYESADAFAAIRDALTEARSLLSLSATAGQAGNEQACEHRDHSFDRSICACGSMHYYCVDCGAQVDECEWSAGNEDA